MNKNKRNLLSKALEYLSNVEDLVERVKSDEEDALDNIPENFQYSARYESIEHAIDSLEEACSSISSARDEICEAIG